MLKTRIKHIQEKNNFSKYLSGICYVPIIKAVVVHGTFSFHGQSHSRKQNMQVRFFGFFFFSDLKRMRLAEKLALVNRKTFGENKLYFSSFSRHLTILYFLSVHLKAYRIIG